MAYPELRYLVDSHLADVHLLVVVPVPDTDVAQIVAPDVGVLLLGLALHPCPHAVGDGLGDEAFVDATEFLLQPLFPRRFYLYVHDFPLFVGQRYIFF